MFEIGDRVIVTIEGISAFEQGALGVVAALDNEGNHSDTVGIAFDDAIGLHGLDGRCKHHHGMWCPKEMVRHYVPSYNRELRRWREKEQTGTTMSTTGSKTSWYRELTTHDLEY